MHWTRFLSLLPALVFWGGVIAIIIQNAIHPTKRSKAEKIILRIVGGIFGAIVLLGIITFVPSLFHSRERILINTANYYARQAGESFVMAVRDLDKEGLLPARSVEVFTWKYGEDTGEMNLPARMDHYGSGSRGGYYAIVTDGEWHVIYALWSEEPLAGDVRPYTQEEQWDSFRLFDREPLVGYYDMQEE